jgi:hypothetical protein
LKERTSVVSQEQVAPLMRDPRQILRSVFWATMALLVLAGYVATGLTVAGVL